MRRRQFLALLATVSVLPDTLRAQNIARARRIGAEPPQLQQQKCFKAFQRACVSWATLRARTSRTSGASPRVGTSASRCSPPR